MMRLESIEVSTEYMIGERYE